MTTAIGGHGRRWRAVLLAAALGAVAHLAFDTWYRGTLLVRERARIKATTEPYATALEGVFNRRLGRLAGLRAFVESKGTVAEVYRDFPTFAAGLRIAALDVRAVQLVRAGSIVASFPPEEAPRVVGYNLMQHPQPDVAADVGRARRVDTAVITGPIDLLQGGRGLLMRLRVSRTDSSFPDLVTMVLDVDPLLGEVEWARSPDGVRIALLDRGGRVLRGDRDALDDPVSTSVGIGDGAFTVLAAPTRGWDPAVADDLRVTRVTTVVIALLLIAIAWGVTGRQESLERAVAARTRDLAAANVRLREESMERSQLEERLLQAQKMEAVGTLAGGIAHDFNNLLTAILGFAQLAEQQVAQLAGDGRAGTLEELEDVRRDLTEIHKAADRATMLTTQLLAFSRRQKVAARPLDVVAVVHDIERMLQRLIGATVTLRTEAGPDPLPVMADGGQFAQVLVNLVVNARDALPNGGSITLRASAVDLDRPADGLLHGLPAGAWVLVAVSDSGIGMPPDVQARMFEPFFTTKAVGEGTGLGLSTVYGIVTQAGGQLFVQSTPGAGTTVTVALPRLPELPEMSLPAATPTTDASDELVLVVEDEAGLRRLVAEILRRRGYRVEVAEDGMAALAHLEHGLKPSLVLTDVVMPRMGGRELASAISTRDDPPPVLFMSGYQAGESLPDDARHGFIGKPFTPEDLVASVRATLGASSAGA